MLDLIERWEAQVVRLREELKAPRKDFDAGWLSGQIQAFNEAIAALKARQGKKD